MDPSLPKHELENAAESMKPPGTNARPLIVLLDPAGMHPCWRIEVESRS